MLLLQIVSSVPWARPVVRGMGRLTQVAMVVSIKIDLLANNTMSAAMMLAERRSERTKKWMQAMDNELAA